MSQARALLERLAVNLRLMSAEATEEVAKAGAVKQERTVAMNVELEKIQAVRDPIERMKLLERRQAKYVAEEMDAENTAAFATLAQSIMSYTFDNLVGAIEKTLTEVPKE